MLTPQDRVRIQLERSLAQDATTRVRIMKRESRAILPTFMSENGKIRRLGHGESRAIIAPNLYFAPKEEMRPIPVRNGLPMVDNRSLLPQTLPPAPEPTPPPVQNIFEFLLGLEQIIVISDEFNTGDTIGGNAVAISYAYPSLIRQPYDENLPPTPSNPIILNPVAFDPNGGEASLTASESAPFITTRIDFTGATNCFLGISNSFAQISDYNFFSSLTIRIRSFASKDGGAFEQIVDTTHTFTESSPLSDELFPDLFECNILECYLLWEFL